MAAVDFKKVLGKPLVAVSQNVVCSISAEGLGSSECVQMDDMTSEMQQEAVEIITASVDKFLSTENYEVRYVFCGTMLRYTYLFLLQKAAQAVKEGLDKKFGPTWHCCVGEGFAFDITHNTKNMIMIYYGEKLGVLAFKC